MKVSGPTVVKLHTMFVPDGTQEGAADAPGAPIPSASNPATTATTQARLAGPTDRARSILGHLR